VRSGELRATALERFGLDWWTVAELFPRERHNLTQSLGGMVAHRCVNRRPVRDRPGTEAAIWEYALAGETCQRCTEPHANGMRR
jgi:hypothetical protein